MVDQLDDINRHFWYHEIELADGVFTAGQKWHSIPATRAILKQVEISGARVLDVGAMEGLFSILCCRRGAQRVMATDRWDYSEKVQIVQRALGVHFDYVPQISLHETSQHLKETWGTLPDVVIFSGVLYHMFDPLGGLARIRGLLPRNGLVIVETLAAISDAVCLHYNSEFSTYGPSTYFIPTTASLGAMMNFVGLQAIDCRYFVCGRKRVRDGFFLLGRQRYVPLCRIAICCRAVEVPALSQNPPWYVKNEHAWYADYVKMDFAEFLDVDSMNSSERSAVEYRVDSGFPVRKFSEGNPLRKKILTECSGLKVEPGGTQLMLRDNY